MVVFNGLYGAQPPEATAKSWRHQISCRNLKIFKGTIDITVITKKWLGLYFSWHSEAPWLGGPLDFAYPAYPIVTPMSIFTAMKKVI